MKSDKKTPYHEKKKKGKWRFSLIPRGKKKNPGDESFRKEKKKKTTIPR